MKLYLVRHALTDEGEQMDAERTINDIGKAQAKAMRKVLRLADVSPDVIICSDFARAEDTAAILQRGDTPIKTTPALRPDPAEGQKYVDAAWKAITKLAGDAKTVLVVTHGPLIQKILASVAFNFLDCKWHWEHGSCAYVNTDKGLFRWFVTPKLAAHLVGDDPKEVENPLAEAQQVANFSWITDLMRLSENLMANTKRAQIQPLRDQARAAITKRWNRQSIRVRKVLKDMRPDIDGGADAAHVSAMLQAALPATDDKFQKAHHAVRTAAYQTGANHVVSQLGDLVAFGSRLGAEAKRPQALPPNIPEPEDTSDVLEAQLDNTTNDRMHTALSDVSPWGYAGALAAVRGMFNEFSDAPEGQLSRADTVALDTVSNAYHEGANAVAQSAQDAGIEVEKRWDVGAEGCVEICQPNADEDWIPFDAPHDSGDFEPPAHPNAVLEGSTFRPYGALQRMVAAEYDGLAIRLYTGEYIATIGPNHPMLTSRGLVAAKLLREGDYLVRDRRPIKPTSFGKPYFDQVVLVEDVFAAIRMRSGNSRVPATANDFHGDRVVTEQEIQVVFPERGLLEERDPSGLERLGEIPLVLADMETPTESSLGTFSKNLSGILLPSPGSVSGGLSGTHFFLSRINRTQQVHFKGWAFDASTEVGLYCSDGFVVSNCDCSEVYRTVGAGEEEE